MSTKIKSEELLDIVKDRIEITDGVATLDKTVQEEGFKRLDTDLATVKHSYNSVALVSNAVAETFVGQAQDYIANNKEHDSVVLKTSIGDENLTLTVDRDSTSRNPKTGDISNHKGALTVRRSIKNRNTETASIKQLAKETGLKKL